MKDRATPNQVFLGCIKKSSCASFEKQANNQHFFMTSASVPASRFLLEVLLHSVNKEL